MKPSSIWNAIGAVLSRHRLAVVWTVLIASLLFRLIVRSAVLMEAAWIQALIPDATLTPTLAPTLPPTLAPTLPPTLAPTVLPPTQSLGPTPLPTLTPALAPAPTPTLLVSPTPLPSPTPPPTPVVRIDPNCALSTSEKGLLVLVDKTEGLGPDFVPPGLVELRLDPHNAFLPPLYLRAPAVQPLMEMLEAMNAAGLRPRVISAYRDYAEQVAAYQKWLNFDPDRGPHISAPPGFSEHQLGTVVDFGSPALGYRFHTNFYVTPEGQWLDRHAVEYGFTLTYPAWAVEQTGFEWEPWHWRYVGKALAQELENGRLTLSAYLAQCAPVG